MEAKVNSKILGDNKNNRISEKKNLYEYIKSYKQQMHYNVVVSKHKVNKDKFDKSISSLNKVIKQKNPENGKKCVLDHPFVNKKQIRSNSNKIEAKTDLVHFKDVMVKRSRRNYNHSQSISSNFTFKNNNKFDIWKDTKMLNSEMKEITKNSHFYEKEIFLMKKKEIKVEKMRNKIREEELKTLKDAPEISKNSLHLISNFNKEDFKPIHKRIYQEQEKKINLLSKLRNDLETTNNKIEGTFIIKLGRNHNNFNGENNLKIGKTETFNKKRFEIWNNNVTNWEKKKKKKIGFLKEKLENDQIVYDNHFPYFPKLNRSFSKFSKSFVAEEKSHNLLERVNFGKSDKIIKIKKIKDDLSSCFQPKLNNSIPRYLKNSSSPSMDFINLLRKKMTKSLIHKNKLSKSMTDIKITNSIQKEEFCSSFDSKTSKWIKIFDKINSLQDVDVNKEKILNLYSINTQDNLAWDKNKECRLIFTPKFSNILLNLTRNRSFVDIVSSDGSSIQYADSIYQSKKNLHVNNNLKI